MKKAGTILLFALFTTVSMAQSGLVAHWSFDSLIGNKFHDHAQGLLNGVALGPTLIQGPVGMALSFDGIDDYARITESPFDFSVPAYLQSLKVGSISIWFKVENVPTNNGIRPIFYYGRQLACNFFDAANEGLIIEVGHSPIHYKSKRLYLTSWTNGCTYPSFCYDSWTPLVEGQWYHYVATIGYNGNSGYLNGVEMTGRNYNFGTAATHEFFKDLPKHETLWLGRGFWNTNAMYFKGAIDELKIFDRPITAVEAAALYAEGFQSVGVKEVEVNKPVMYPNPTSKYIMFEGLTPHRVKIYTLSGALVQDEEVDPAQPVLNLPELKDGVYIVNMEYSTHHSFERLIIQNP